MRPTLSPLWLLLPALAMSCGSGAKNPPKRPVAGKTSAKLPLPERGPLLLGEAPVGALGPYMAHNGVKGLALYAAKEGGENRWRSIAFRLPGDLIAETPLGPAPGAVVSMTLSPLAQGYEAVWIEQRAGGCSVQLALLDERGAWVRPPFALVEHPSTLTFAELVSLPTSDLVVWAIPQGTVADLWGMSVLHDGSPQGSPSLLVKGVSGWRFGSQGDEVFLATMRPLAGPAKAPPTLQVELARVRSGHVEGKPTIIAQATASVPDVEMVHLGKDLLVAWNDARDGDSRVWVSVVQPEGMRAGAPHPAAPPTGEQLLTRLVERDGRGVGALLAWESPQAADVREAVPRSSRTIHLIHLDGQGQASGDGAVLVVPPEREVEIVSDRAGYAAIGYLPTCEDRSCDTLDPWLMRLSGDLAVVAADPVRPLKSESRPLSWGLDCVAADCGVLTAQGEQTISLFRVPVPFARPGRTKVPPSLLMVRDGDRPKPRWTTVQRVARERVAAIAAAPVGVELLVGWVSYVPKRVEGGSGKAPAKKKSSAREASVAKVMVQALSATGIPREPQLLSVRAESAGGIALASDSKGKTCAAWVGRDAGNAQVFVTKMDAIGHKEQQRMLTHIRGEASDVAVAWAGDGWLVAWVDSREGSPQVYVTKVDEELREVLAEQRVRAPGVARSERGADVASVSLLAGQGELVITWSERLPQQERGAIRVVRLSTSDLHRIAEETPDAMGGLDLRSPTIATVGSQRLLVVLAEEDGRSAAKVTALGSAQTGNQSWETLPLPGDVQGLGLSCDERVCHGIGVGEVDASMTLTALLYRPDQKPVSRPLLSVRDAPATDVAPLVVGSFVVFADDSRASPGVSVARVQWE